MSSTPTYAELRDQARKAISDIMRKGVSHSAEGRSMTRADLGALRETEAYYTRLAARETNGGITIRAGTPVDG